METFQEYLAARRTKSANGSAQGSLNGHSASQQRAREEAARRHMRAVKNWKRAKYAVTKKITQDMLGVQRRSAAPLNNAMPPTDCFVIMIQMYLAQLNCSNCIGHAPFVPWGQATNCSLSTSLLNAACGCFQGDFVMSSTLWAGIAMQ